MPEDTTAAALEQPCATNLVVVVARRSTKAPIEKLLEFAVVVVVGFCRLLARFPVRATNRTEAHSTHTYNIYGTVYRKLS